MSYRPAPRISPGDWVEAEITAADDYDQRRMGAVYVASTVDQRLQTAGESRLHADHFDRFRKHDSSLRLVASVERPLMRPR